MNSEAFPSAPTGAAGRIGSGPTGDDGDAPHGNDEPGHGVAGETVGADPDESRGATGSGLGSAFEEPGPGWIVDSGSVNVTPRRYRQVSLSEAPSLEPADLVNHFTGREAYKHTHFVVARKGARHALVELARKPADPAAAPLFSPPVAARLLAGADECVYVRDASVDTGIVSQLAAVARRTSPAARCVIVEGLYRHVSFILNPSPVEVEVVDEVPPEPAKLVDQVRRVLATDETLPAIVVDENIIDSRAVLAESSQRRHGEAPATVLVPCQGGGGEINDTQTHYLDQRPEQTDWTLLGCERSRSIHRWFYDSEPPEVVDTCPRRFVTAANDADGEPRLRLSRCCMLEEGIEFHDGTAWVPWGATLGEVSQALHLLATAGKSPRLSTPS